MTDRTVFIFSLVPNMRTTAYGYCYWPFKKKAGQIRSLIFRYVKVISEITIECVCLYVVTEKVPASQSSPWFLLFF